MNLYRFHWRDGVIDEGRGSDPADALTKLGFGAGAIAALDYWELVQPGLTPRNRNDNNT